MVGVKRARQTSLLDVPHEFPVFSYDSLQGTHMQLPTIKTTVNLPQFWHAGRIARWLAFPLRQ
eukprot:3122988-Pleurochrysis_carterae.AAC.1